MTQFSGRTPAYVRVVWDGQSLNQQPVGNDAPKQLHHGSSIPYANISAAGNGWYDLINSSAHMTLLRNNARNRAGCYDILIMNGGQGDVLNASPSGGQTGEVCYTRAVAYRDAAVALGYHKVILPSWPAWGPDMLGTGRPTTAEEAARNTFNAMVMANTGSFDGIVNMHSGVLADATNLTYFQFDRLHPTAAGARAIKEAIEPVLYGIIDALP